MVKLLLFEAKTSKINPGGWKMEVREQSGELMVDGVGFDGNPADGAVDSAASEMLTTNNNNHTEGNMQDLTSRQDLDLFERQAARFSLIPLDGKKPFEKDWQQWCEAKRAFNRKDFEGHNAGVCCGPASEVLVLDVDDPQAFEALLLGNGLAVPETRTVITGSGKPHFYFKYPQGGVRVGNKSFKHPVFPRHTIYDIRGVGGQVVAAGFIHPETGKL
jgi:hypothetical protein